MDSSWEGESGKIKMCGYIFLKKKALKLDLMYPISVETSKYIQCLKLNK